MLEIISYDMVILLSLTTCSRAAAMPILYIAVSAIFKMHCTWMLMRKWLMWYMHVKWDENASLFQVYAHTPCILGAIHDNIPVICVYLPIWNLTSVIISHAYNIISGPPLSCRRCFQYHIRDASNISDATNITVPILLLSDIINPEICT